MAEPAECAMSNRAQVQVRTSMGGQHAGCQPVVPVIRGLEKVTTLLGTYYRSIDHSLFAHSAWCIKDSYFYTPNLPRHVTRQDPIVRIHPLFEARQIRDSPNTHPTHPRAARLTICIRHPRPFPLPAEPIAEQVEARPSPSGSQSAGCGRE